VLERPVPLPSFNFVRTIVYVTNAEESRLSLEQAVNYYREQWQPERGFHHFKRGRLPALAIYFQDSDGRIIFNPDSFCLLPC
jgi:transposase